MKNLVCVTISLILITQTLFALAYMASTDENVPAADNYADVARLWYYARKRSCIKRGSSCDHRPDDCCYNSSCRCNLWGTNCRCQRMGLFQKWGK